MPDLLLHSPLLGLAVTLVTYRLGEWLVARFNLKLLPPFVISTLLTMLLIVCQVFTYKEYETGGSIIAFLLGPATVALALPLFNHWQLLKQNFGILIAGVLAGTCSGILSILFCAKLFGVTREIALSMVPKSITTPIAMEVSATLGGIPALTIACVVFTGVLGAICGHKLLALAGVRNNMAIGLAIGAASHGIGVGSCISVSAQQVAMGSLAIALVGITTALLAPVFVYLLL